MASRSTYKRGHRFLDKGRASPGMETSHISSRHVPTDPDLQSRVSGDRLAAIAEEDTHRRDDGWPLPCERQHYPKATKSIKNANVQRDTIVQRQRIEEFNIEESEPQLSYCEGGLPSRDIEVEAKTPSILDIANALTRTITETTIKAHKDNNRQASNIIAHTTRAILLATVELIHGSSDKQQRQQQGQGSLGRQEAQAPSQQETKKAADAVTMSCDIDECIHTELQDRLRCIEPMLIKRIRDAYGVDAPSIPHSERLRRNVAEHAAFGSTISDMSPIMLRRAQKGGLAVPPLLLSVKSALDKVTLRVDDIDAKLSISVPKASIGVGTHEPITATCFSLDDFQTEGDDGWPLPPECHPTTDEGEDGCPLPSEWKDKGEISGCPLPSEWKDEDKDEGKDGADDDGGCPLPSEWNDKDGEDGCPFHTDLKDKDGEDDGCPLPLSGMKN